MPTQPTVTVTITLPDGSTLTPTPAKVEAVPDSPGTSHVWHVGDLWNVYATITDPNNGEEVIGIYKVSEPLTQAGSWHSAWATTGSYQAAQPDSIRVLND